MWLYQTLDILSTILEGFCLYVISRCLCKEPRFQTAINKFIPPIAEIMLTYALTWFTEFGAWKMPLIFLFVVAILKICYKDTVYQIVTVTEVWFVVIVFLSEAIYFSIGSYYEYTNRINMVYMMYQIFIKYILLCMIIYYAVVWYYFKAR